MSNKNQETIADIAAKMRGLADRIEKLGLYDLRECGTDYLRALADLIEAAEKQSVTNCNRFGNSAAMREALEQIYYLVNSLDEDCAVDPIDIRDIARVALSAPGSAVTMEYVELTSERTEHRVLKVGCSKRQRSREMKKTKTITNKRKQCKSPKTCDQCKTWKRDGKTCVGTCPHQDGMTAEWMSGCPFFHYKTCKLAKHICRQSHRGDDKKGATNDK